MRKAGKGEASPATFDRAIHTAVHLEAREHGAKSCVRFAGIASW